MNLNAEYLKGFAGRVFQNPEKLSGILSAFVLVDMPKVTATTSLLPLEPWQIVALKLGFAAYLTSKFGLTVASRLRENEGSSKWQKSIANKSLIVSGVATAALDAVILTAPF